MNWIERLDKHGQNFLIDELVYFLDSGQVVVSIEKSAPPDGQSGYKFKLDNGTEETLKVPKHLLDQHWTEAQQIVSLFPELSSLSFL